MDPSLMKISGEFVPMPSIECPLCTKAGRANSRVRSIVAICHDGIDVEFTLMGTIVLAECRHPGQKSDTGPGYVQLFCEDRRCRWQTDEVAIPEAVLAGVLRVAGNVEAHVRTSMIEVGAALGSLVMACSQIAAPRGGQLAAGIEGGN